MGSTGNERCNSRAALQIGRALEHSRLSVTAVAVVRVSELCKFHARHVTPLWFSSSVGECTVASNMSKNAQTVTVRCRTATVRASGARRHCAWRMSRQAKHLHYHSDPPLAACYTAWSVPPGCRLCILTHTSSQRTQRNSVSLNK